MNAKKAKVLRRHAREQTVGQPDRQLVVTKTNKTTVINHPQSTRGFYRHLKKGYKQGLITV